tara:strand:- start:4167 stop:5255 length:1089 start_codon:yes stop_codon:yes gene_type:complete
MKILYISPENTVGTLSTWKKYHLSKKNDCKFITFYKTANSFDSGICLNLPLISTNPIYRGIRTQYYNFFKGAGGDYLAKKGNPPKAEINSFREKLFFRFRDWLWSFKVERAIQEYNLLDFDVYHFEWGLDFYRNCSFVKRIKRLKKPIICTYHGQDMRTRGVIEPLNAFADVSLTSELDLLSLHSKLKYLFLPIKINKNEIFKKTENEISICHSPTNRHYKGSDKIISICKKICSRYKNVKFTLIENMDHHKVINLKRTSDILIDQIGDNGGWGYGMNSVEAMGLYTCCMTEMNSSCRNFFKNHPMVNVNQNNLEKKLIDLILNPEKIDYYKQKAYDWAIKNHDVEVVGKNLYNYYSMLMNE